MKYSQDNCVEVLRTESIRIYSDGKHCALLAFSYIKIAFSKVGHNFLIKDFIFLQGRSQVKQTYRTGLQKNNHN